MDVRRAAFRSNYAQDRDGRCGRSKDMSVGLSGGWRRALVSTAALGLSALPLVSAAAVSPEATAQTATVVTALSSATYGSVLVVGGTSPTLAGAPLYLFTGDAGGRFGCTTKVAPSAF